MGRHLHRLREGNVVSSQSKNRERDEIIIIPGMGTKKATFASILGGTRGGEAGLKSAEG